MAAHQVQVVLAGEVVGQGGVGLGLGQLPPAVGEVGPHVGRVREPDYRSAASGPVQLGVPGVPGGVEPIGGHERDAGQHGDVGLPGAQEMILA